MPGRPVRVLWSRADELAWSPVGAAAEIDLAADFRLRDTAGEPLIIYPKSPRPSYADQVLDFYREAGVQPQFEPGKRVQQVQQHLGLGELAAREQHETGVLTQLDGLRVFVAVELDAQRQGTAQFFGEEGGVDAFGRDPLTQFRIRPPLHSLERDVVVGCRGRKDPHDSRHGEPDNERRFRQFAQDRRKRQDGARQDRNEVTIQPGRDERQRG